LFSDWSPAVGVQRYCPLFGILLAIFLTRTYVAGESEVFWIRSILTDAPVGKPLVCHAIDLEKDPTTAAV